jgi:hypothetical protein
VTFVSLREFPKETQLAQLKHCELTSTPNVTEIAQSEDDKNTNDCEAPLAWKSSPAMRHSRRLERVLAATSETNGVEGERGIGS